MFITVYDKISSVIAIICGLAIVLCPIIFGTVLYLNFKNLTKPKIKA